MSLYENLIALVNKYFYKTEEKPVKYNEWLTSEYVNGKWYIGEKGPTVVTPFITDATYKIVRPYNPVVAGIYIYGENISANTNANISNLGNYSLYSSITIEEGYITFAISAAGYMGTNPPPTTITITLDSYFDEGNNILYEESTQTITLKQ